MTVTVTTTTGEISDIVLDTKSGKHAQQKCSNIPIILVVILVVFTSDFVQIGTVTLSSWRRKIYGHSCGTVHGKVQEECIRSYRPKPTDNAMCNAGTFQHGTSQGLGQLVFTLNGFVWSQQSKVKILTNASPPRILSKSQE